MSPLYDQRLLAVGLGPPNSSATASSRKPFYNKTGKKTEPRPAMFCWLGVPAGTQNGTEFLAQTASFLKLKMGTDSEPKMSTDFAAKMGKDLGHPYTNLLETPLKMRSGLLPI